MALDITQMDNTHLERRTCRLRSQLAECERELKRREDQRRTRQEEYVKRQAEYQREQLRTTLASMSEVERAAFLASLNQPVA